MTTPSIPSSNPLKIMLGDTVVATYDKWSIPNAMVSVRNDNVQLMVTFSRCRALKDGTLEQAPGNYQEMMTISDILTDKDLTASTQAFFTALVTKAMTSGLIS